MCLLLIAISLLPRIQEDLVNQKKLLDLWNFWLLILLLITSLDRSFINLPINIGFLNIELTIEFYH